MTGRGLYVGMTRGRVANTALVIAKTGSGSEATDTLARILATDRTDRTDTPATTDRRHLADRQPRPRTPTMRPRADRPDWFPTWQHELRTRVGDIDSALIRLAEQRPDLEHAVARAVETHRQALC